MVLSEPVSCELKPIKFINHQLYYSTLNSAWPLQPKTPPSVLVRVVFSTTCFSLFKQAFSYTFVRNAGSTGLHVDYNLSVIISQVKHSSVSLCHTAARDTDCGGFRLNDQGPKVDQLYYQLYYLYYPKAWQTSRVH